VPLGERPGREIVLGAAARFWTPQLSPHDVTPDQFARYHRPRCGPIAPAFAVLPFEREQSLLSFDAWVNAHDLAARRWAEPYWHTVKPRPASSPARCRTRSTTEPPARAGMPARDHFGETPFPGAQSLPSQRSCQSCSPGSRSPRPGSNAGIRAGPHAIND
jgi:hypothetical protein